MSRLLAKCVHEEIRENDRVLDTSAGCDVPPVIDAVILKCESAPHIKFYYWKQFWFVQFGEL